MSKQGVTITREFRKPRRRKVEITEREVDGVLMSGKECTKCGEWKPLETGFYNDKNTSDGKDTRCKSCKQKWREDNKQYFKEHYRNWYQKNRESRLEYNKKWRQENREYFLKWSKENSELLMIKKQKRRARESLLPNDWTVEQKTKTWLYFNNSCALTGETDDVDADHIIPLSVGHVGTIYENMIPLRSCLNESKKDRNIFEWFSANRERFNLDEQRFNNLIEYLATLNGLTFEEYRQFVYWCHENPREPHEIAADPRHSIEIWREASGLHFPLPAYAIENDNMSDNERLVS
jgi:hypothetical protein